MKFTVTYRPVAESKLAAMWMNDPNRTLIAQAADAIDALLEKDPLAVGESRSGNERIIFYEPLAVLYEVDEDAHEVHVLSIGPSRPRKQQ